MEKYYKGHLCWLKDQGHYHPHDDKDRLIHYAFPQCIIHSETCIKGTLLSEHPVLSGHWSIPRRCPLNTGYTVFIHVGDWAPCNLPTFFRVSSLILQEGGNIRDPGNEVANFLCFLYLVTVNATQYYD